MANPRLLKLSNAALLQSLKYRYFGGKSTKSLDLERPNFDPHHEDVSKIWPWTMAYLSFILHLRAIFGLFLN
jgi:hypothetical protein